MTRLIAVLLLALAPGITAQEPVFQTGLKKLTDNVYVWSDVHPSGLYLTNDLIVITTDGVLVADGQKDAETTKKMVDGIRALTNQPIKYVVIGSEHGDHTGGNKSFPSTTTFVANPQVLRMGGTEIHVLNNGRAHTGSDLEVYLPREKVFFVSEVFSNHIFPNMRASVPSEWLQTVRKIRQVDALHVIPGHGNLQDAATLKNELAAFERSIEYIIAEVTRLHAAGADVATAQKQVNWGPYAAWNAADRNGPVAVQRVYDELEGKLK